MPKERRRCIRTMAVLAVLPFGGCGTTEQAVIVPDCTLDASQLTIGSARPFPPLLGSLRAPLLRSTPPSGSQGLSLLVLLLLLADERVGRPARQTHNDRC
jgi:hypothetical protein